MRHKFLFLLIPISLLGIFGIWIWHGLFGSPGGAASETERLYFTIQKGEGSRTIAENLEKEHLTQSQFLFHFYTFFTGTSSKLQAGEYELNPSMSIADIVKKLAAGDTIKRTLTIVEGWNLRDIALAFSQATNTSQDDFYAITGYPAEDYRKESQFAPANPIASFYDFLEEKPSYVSLEGFLFPDTYEITSTMTPQDFIEKALENFQKKLNSEIRSEIVAQGKTIFEILTMASLLEKEVQTYDDKQLVSGILWKRLEAAMPLQVDATTSYSTGKRATKISREETQIDSPYNTYLYQGLPLGPIANPGIESIRAALHPEESPYWYYLSTPEGKTIFSKTLQEHNQAKAKYLK